MLVKKTCHDPKRAFSHSILILFRGICENFALPLLRLSKCSPRSVEAYPGGRYSPC